MPQIRHDPQFLHIYSADLEENLRNGTTVEMNAVRLVIVNIIAKDDWWILCIAYTDSIS